MHAAPADGQVLSSNFYLSTYTAAPSCEYYVQLRVSARIKNEIVGGIKSVKMRHDKRMKVLVQSE